MNPSNDSAPSPPVSETTPSPLRAVGIASAVLSETTKSPLRSLTIWVQVVAVLAALVPAVQAWLVSNPVEFVAVLAAVNVIVRFVTHGRVTLFQPGDNDETGGPHAGSVVGLTMAAGLLFLLLPSCAALKDSGLVGLVTFQDSSGAKGGLRVSGGTASPFLRVPIYDPATGELRGMVQLEREPAVIPAK